MGKQACTEASYHNFRKERLSAAEAATASQAEEPKVPCLVPTVVQRESAALSASQPAAAKHPVSAPQGEPRLVKIPPEVGILRIRLDLAWLLIGQVDVSALFSWLALPAAPLIWMFRTCTWVAELHDMLLFDGWLLYCLAENPQGLPI